MEQITNIIYQILFLLSLTYIYFNGKDMIKDIQNEIKEEKTFIDKFNRTVNILLDTIPNCPKCFTFWIALITTQNIIVAAFYSFFADFIYKK